MPRAKKSTTDQLAELRRKQEQIKARMAFLEGRKKADELKREARRKNIVGAAVLAQAQADPSFLATLRPVLVAAVTRPNDKDAIADLLAIPSPAPT